MRAALILASVAALAACNFSAGAQERDGDDRGGGGQMTQRSYNLAGFKSVGLAGPHDVVVTVGPAYSVRAEGDSEVLDRLEITVEDGSLQVGTKRDSRRWFSSGDRPKATIYVSLPAIDGAAIAGSGDMRIDKVEGSRFAASIGGSGDMEIAALRVGDAKFSIAGSGDISANGTAQRADISIAGSGDVDLGGVEMRTAAVSVVGSGGVRAKAMETAEVSIMGSGDVEISGSARCSVSKMGSGSLRCGG